MNKKIAIVLCILVGLALCATFYLTLKNNKKAEQDNLAKQTAENQAKQIVTVSGLIGSEKQDFFNDSQVKSILESKYKIRLDIQPAGSRSIATKGGKKGKADQYDFVFPSGSPTADKIKKDFKVQNAYRVFFTPMAVASWKPVVDVLEKNAIVKKTNNHYRIIDMGKLQDLMTQQTRWQDLPNNDSFKVGRKVLIKSTNIASSNSASMYLSLASYLANNKSIVENDSQIAQVIPKVTPLFTGQGYMAGSSATPFEDYLNKGQGDSPLVMIYEAQFLAQAQQGSVRPDMILLYPEPTIYTDHTLLAMNDNGKKLGEALTTDPDLQKLAIKYGFRNYNSQLAGEQFNQMLKDKKLDFVPTTLNEVIDPPSYEVLEKMISQIEQQMK